MISEKQIALKITEKECKLFIEGLKAERDKKISMNIEVQDELELLDDMRNIYQTHFLPKPKVEVVAPSTYQNPNEKKELV